MVAPNDILARNTGKPACSATPSRENVEPVIVFGVTSCAYCSEAAPTSLVQRTAASALGSHTVCVDAAGSLDTPTALTTPSDASVLQNRDQSRRQRAASVVST